MYLSILIRNLNEGYDLKKTLLAIKRQQAGFEYEIIVIDNESDDNSVAIARQMGCEVYVLKRREFTYGYALNYGISKCKGEIIFIVSSHVILLNDFFLKNIPNFFTDKSVAALRFVLSTSPQTVAESVRKGPVALLYQSDENFAFSNWKNFIVNHCSAIRRNCWQLQNFNEALYSSEDKLWSLEILKKGYTILYNVPCFYVYTKKVERWHKIHKQAIDIAAKEMITHKRELFFSGFYFLDLLKMSINELKKMRTQIVIHHKIYKGIQKRKKANRLILNSN